MVIVSSVMLTGLTLAGRSLLVNLIGDVYHLARETSHHPEVKATLNRLDLEADLKVIEALLSQIENSNPNQPIQKQDPIQICLDQVHQMIHKIKEELEQVHQIIQDHQHKWFANWRTPGYGPNLKAIGHHKKILDHRVEMLFKVLRFRG